MGVLQKAREKLQRWRKQPIDMVREEFHVEPDPWQAEALAAFADPAVERLAIKSAKGPGKTALLAWIGLNFIATRPEPKIASTSITGDPDDPRRSTRIKIEWARQQIASYGRENPWVKVNVLGEFPPSSINALLGVEEVEAAMRRHLPRDVWEWAQKRLGVDVARFGDDRTTIFPRQGMAAFRPVIMRQAKTTAIAARVAKAITDWGAELTIVDDTGHWGHGVIDQLTDAGYPVLPLVYSDKALDPHYSTRRCEIWMLMADWVIAGGALPNRPELVGELTEPTYTFIGGKFVVEPKPLVKERIGRSPDLADALAETFAIPDMPSELMAKLHARGTALRDANPYEVQQQLREGAAGRALRDFDPLESFER